MKSYHLIIVLAVAVVLILFSLNYNSIKKSNVEAIDTINTVKISFVGDLMCHTPQMKYAEISADSFDFNPVFDSIKQYFRNSDLICGNLETTISGKKEKYSGYPRFNAPLQFLEGIKQTGFNFLFTSNNHSFDRGKKGVLATLEKIKEFGINSSGTYSSQKERDSIKILDVNGFKFGFLSYTYGLNGYSLPKDEKYLVNLIDTTAIKNDIQNYRSKNPDLILVYFHFGDEYSRKPSTFQKSIVNKTLEYGADIIIGSHPHVVQPTEIIPNPKSKLGKSVVAYSLGNFISNQRWRYSDAGEILNISISKNILTDSCWLDDLSIVPTWVFKGKTDSLNQYIILPADTNVINTVPAYLSKSDKQKMSQSYKDTRKMFPDKFPDSTLIK